MYVIIVAVLFVQQVTVIDDGIPMLSSTTCVVIAVEDVNDNAPEMLKKAYRFKIAETQPVQEPLTQENDTISVAEIDEQLDKKPWTNFGPNDIVGPSLFRVRILLLLITVVMVLNFFFFFCVY